MKRQKANLRRKWMQMSPVLPPEKHFSGSLTVVEVWFMIIRMPITNRAADIE
jgi:hypothetical protein